MKLMKDKGILGRLEDESHHIWAGAQMWAKLCHFRDETFCHSIIMSKNHLAISRTRLPAVCRCLAISLLIFGFGPGVWASIPWDTTISFTGEGNLESALDAISVNQPGLTPPQVSVSMGGSGVYTATPNGGGYDVSSSFNVFPSVTLGTTTFSVTQPTQVQDVGGQKELAAAGPDPGVTISAPTASLPGDPSSPPFYGAFPPPSGTQYTGSIGFAPGYQPYKFFFFYNGTQYYVTFSGLVTLTLGNSPTLSQSGDTYSYSYNHSVLDLNGDVKENDPGIDFYGDVVITTTAVVPEPSGLVAGLALLAVFAGSTWRERRAA